MSEEIPQRTEYQRWVRIGLVILGLVLLLPGACGGFFLGGVSLQWLGDGGRWNDPYAPLVVGVAAMSFLASMFLFGMLLRFSQWSIAPTLSLAVAIASAICIVLAFVTMNEFFDRSLAGDLLTLVLTLIVGLLLCVFAPLQYWVSHRKPKGGSST